jgi:hypothetical protein
MPFRIELTLPLVVVVVDDDDDEVSNERVATLTPLDVK